MSSFSISVYEVLLLVVYAQAANMHLLLMREVQFYGEEWGYSQGDIDIFYKEQIQFVAKHSDYCIEWYDSGLGQFPRTTSRDWVNYNYFRRELTLIVLDVIALFSSYDARMYPLETTTELTRSVRTTPIVNTTSPYSWVDHDWVSFYGYENMFYPPFLFS
ncbi:hypothetical protein ABE07_11315 [Bacillus thuringiensis]|nr:Pesticidal crystal protein cry8Aa [Bacillus thuringiensis serovar indiana]MBG9643329.1 hypothetical protein [Bacillus thuringiensis]MBG9649225.1 hypothetical protein [Bacillus thuringiensis]MRB43007.1 hypothetical protein [Bacillus thuringiensis]MRB84686.1 hypothetical protein [Bacillus thuringiensis]